MPGVVVLCAMAPPVALLTPMLVPVPEPVPVLALPGLGSPPAIVAVLVLPPARLRHSMEPPYDNTAYVPFAAKIVAASVS